MKSIVYCILSIVVFLSIQGSETKRLMQLSDLVDSPFHANKFIGGWWSDTELIVQDDNVLKIFDASTNNIRTLGDGSYLTNYSASDWRVTNDFQWISLQHNCEQIYRYSNLCNYTLVEVNTGAFVPVAGGKMLQLFRFTRKGHSFVYVMDNDVYYQECPKSDAVRVSTNGIAGIIYNGVGDWVYEEEVLADTRAIAIAPEVTKLAYCSYDDSNVTLFHYPIYGDPGSLDWQYVEDKTVKFPKVGTTNPTATVHIFDLKTKQEIMVKGLKAPVNILTNDHILAKVTWVDDNNVVVSWLNRAQTIAVSTMCDLTTLECNKILETSNPNGWVEYPVLFFKNKSYFATILPQPQGDAGTYQHLTVVSNMVQKSLTTGKIYVKKIIDYDTTNSLIYYTATDEIDPKRINFYVIPDDGSGQGKCLSCDNCASATAMMSRNWTYYLLCCGGPAPYFFSVYSCKTNTFIKEVLNNSDAADKLQEIILPEISNFELDLTDGFNASVRLFCPPGMDKNGKYPLVLDVDGSPDFAYITDQYYPPDFNYYMCTAMQIIVARVDVRGAGNRGDKCRFATYRKVGVAEIDDFINVTKKLIAKFSFIDAKRVGIYGDEFGGYTSAMVLAKDSENIFKCGVSASPIIFWIDYDSIFSERYMGLPTEEDNKDGYKNSDITQYIQGFAGKNFLLIAGTKGYDKQYQHAAALARSLQLNTIPFEMQSYIDEGFPEYGYSDPMVQLHYYNTMVMFWSENFGLNSTNCTSSAELPPSSNQ